MPAYFEFHAKHLFDHCLIRVMLIHLLCSLAAFEDLLFQLVLIFRHADIPGEAG